MDIVEHYALAPLTTFKVGGTARYFARVRSIADAEAALQFAHEKGLPIVVIGGGSNTLVDDGEAQALCIQPQFHGIERDGLTLIVSSTESWDEVVAYAVEQGLYGIENLSGIPGSLGGAIVQNIGAYGAALSEVCLWVEAFDLQEKRTVRFKKEECAFGYRDSIFKQHPGRFLIMRAALALSGEGEVRISYRDIADYFGDRTPTLAGVRGAVLSIRAAKFPDLTQEGTAGSFFKNPIVSLQEGERLQERYPALPLFPLPEATGYKVPLAWILDSVLSMRGFALGSVRCFERQPLVLVASKGASARDVRALAHEVMKRVFAETGIHIEPEVCIMRGASIAKEIHF